jgi:hypothetical protein
VVEAFGATVVNTLVGTSAREGSLEDIDPGLPDVLAT